MNKAESFMNILKTDPRAKEWIKNCEAPLSDEEAINDYLHLAEIVGFEITKEELVNGFHAVAAGMQARTRQAEAELEKIALDPETLDNVAGGKAVRCQETYQPGEWCWWTDSCEAIINLYN